MACSATFGPLGAAPALEAVAIERKRAGSCDLATKNDIRVAVAEVGSRISRDIADAVAKVVLVVSLVNTVIGGVIVAALKLL